MKPILAVILVSGLLSACATPATIGVSGGDQAKGTVVLSYDIGLMQSPKVDWKQGLQKAAAKCQGWGYASALPAGKPSKACKTKTQGGDCIGWTISETFQCTAPAAQSSAQ
ncbi:MAG: YecR family lipoprotein [Alcanivorax sp.]|nr:YecR family lipoprotein [Alcanivorax sp.]